MASLRSGLDSSWGYAEEARANAVVSFSSTGTGGTFKVTIEEWETGNIAYNASLATFQAAIEALPNVKAGDFTFTGGALGSAAIVMTAVDERNFSNRDYTVTVDATSVTGGTVTRTKTTTGKGYGGGATPVRWVTHKSEGVQLQAERIESEGIQAGQGAVRADRWISDTSKGASGPVAIELDDSASHLILKHIFGDTVTKTNPATGVYRYEYETSSLYGLSLATQTIVPGVDGVNYVKRHTGVKITEAEISVEVGAFSDLTITVDAQQETFGGVATDPVYPGDSTVLSFMGGHLSIDGGTLDVKSASISWNNGLDTERVRMNRAFAGTGKSVKREPTQAAMREVMMSVTCDLDSYSWDLYQKFVNGETAEVILSLVGKEIGTTGYFSGLTLIGSAARFDGTPTPSIAGTETVEVTFEVKFLAPTNGDPQLRAIYISPVDEALIA